MSYLDQLSDKVWQFRYSQAKNHLDHVCNANALWENWAKIIYNALDQGRNYIKIENQINTDDINKINQDPYYQGSMDRFKDDLTVWFNAFNHKYDLDPTAQVEFNRDQKNYLIKDQIIIYLDVNHNLVDLVDLLINKE